MQIPLFKPQTEWVKPEKFPDFISQDGVKKIWSNFLDNRCSWSRPWSLYVLKKWIDKNL